MRRHVVLLVAIALMLMLVLVWPAGALAAPAPGVSATGPTITATGTGQAPVTPQDRHNSASIAAAVKAAGQAAVPLAFQAAHDQAVRYAQIAGLTLGAVQSISDTQNGNGAYVPYGPFGGPFGPGQYCGTVRQPVFRMVKGHRKLIRVKRVYRCFVPRFASLSVSLTYNAS